MDRHKKNLAFLLTIVWIRHPLSCFCKTLACAFLYKVLNIYHILNIQYTKMWIYIRDQLLHVERVNICLDNDIEHFILVSSAFGVYRRWNSHPKAYRWKLPQTNAYYAFICKYIFMKIRMHVVHSLKNTPIKFLWQNNVCSFRYSVLKSANNTQCSVFKYTKVWIHIRDQLLHVYRTNIILCLQVSIKYTCILF